MYSLLFQQIFGTKQSINNNKKYLLIGGAESNYFNVMRLGNGAQGQVYKVMESETGEFRIKKSIPNNSKATNEYDISRFMMSLPDHPNIAKIVDVQKEDHVINVYMRDECGESLKRLNEKIANNGTGSNEFTFLPPILINKIVVQILNGLQFLHNNKILHCDIKADNVIFTNNSEVKLIDLGIAKKVDSFPTKANYGTGLYISPESGSQEEIQPHNFGKSDVWSVGVLIAEMFCDTSNIIAEKDVIQFDYALSKFGYTYARYMIYFCLMHKIWGQMDYNLIPYLVKLGIINRNIDTSGITISTIDDFIKFLNTQIEDYKAVIWDECAKYPILIKLLDIMDLCLTINQNARPNINTLLNALK